MHHEITLICDDIRQELGNKVSIIGIYDEAMVLEEIPGRLPKLCFFQVWRADKDVFQEAGRLQIELRGSAVDSELAIEAIAHKPNPDRDPPKKGRLAVTFAPIEIAREGEIEFVTTRKGDPSPLHIQKLRVALKSKNSRNGSIEG